ncbi:hypothetical protein HBN50_16425 [Halobacteriovorax sp. GB3]|uniref:hypothetical protein n=1 Tax=Halobacteriovorax sp. GB3 TaxID=2719615 RepID=UPI0023627573|nr:hypothetical protein [Halobacteriovorax sp. GB3]MDD0854696.1 hypothetical protein [Halobacteriovorax sp. GB3]
MASTFSTFLAMMMFVLVELYNIKTTTSNFLRWSKSIFLAFLTVSVVYSISILNTESIENFNTIFINTNLRTLGVLLSISIFINALLNIQLTYKDDSFEKFSVLLPSLIFLAKFPAINYYGNYVIIALVLLTYLISVLLFFFNRELKKRFSFFVLTTYLASYILLIKGMAILSILHFCILPIVVINFKALYSFFNYRERFESKNEFTKLFKLLFFITHVIGLMIYLNIVDSTILVSLAIPVAVLQLTQCLFLVVFAEMDEVNDVIASHYLTSLCLIVLTPFFIFTNLKDKLFSSLSTNLYNKDYVQIVIEPETYYVSFGIILLIIALYSYVIHIQKHKLVNSKVNDFIFANGFSFVKQDSEEIAVIEKSSEESSIQRLNYSFKLDEGKISTIILLMSLALSILYLVRLK